jgi:hypothetical protein
VSAEDERPAPGDQKPLPGTVAFLGMGLSAAVCVGLGVVLGLWLVTAAMSVIKQIRTYL